MSGSPIPLFDSSPWVPFHLSQSNWQLHSENHSRWWCERMHHKGTMWSFYCSTWQHLLPHIEPPGVHTLTNKAICNILQHLSLLKITTSPYCFTNQAPCSHHFFFFLLPLYAPLFLKTLSNLVPKLPGLNGPGSSMRWTGVLVGGGWGERGGWVLYKRNCRPLPFIFPASSCHKRKLDITTIEFLTM